MNTTRISNRSPFLAAAICSFVCLTAVAQDVAPELAISLNDTNVSLSWNTNFPDFALERTGDPAAGWTAEAIITNCSVALGRNADKQFFRLKKAVTLTYIANEGFLFTGDGKQVLIDAIFNDGYGQYYTPPTEVLFKERGAYAPFDRVDALLLTHYHADHCYSPYVVQHMQRNQAATLIATAQVTNQLGTVTGYAQITNRVIVASPAPGTAELFPIAGIDFKVIPLQHASDSGGSIQHLGFLFSIDGLKMFHPGDTANDLQAYQTLNLAEEHIDIAFCPQWFFDDLLNARAIIDYLNPRTLIVMHVRIGRSSYYRDRINAMTNLPPVYLMDSPMVSLRFPVGDSPQD
jgi:L-ascorbate metabolism protein UlaG (beta-lactamase superfamily)